MKKPVKKAAPRSAKRPASRPSDGMRPEYDFTGAVRAKYAARFREGTNLVLLDPDVAAAFQDSAAVNHALRSLLELVPPKARRRHRTA